LNPVFLVVIPGPPALSAGGTGLRSRDCKREREATRGVSVRGDATTSMLLFEQAKWIPGCRAMIPARPPE